MIEPLDLTPYELKLLDKAIPYAREIKASTERYPTQDELKKFLHCSSVSAQRLQRFLVRTDAVKVANKADTKHNKAVDKAVLDVVVDAPFQSNEEFVLREHARLARSLAKLKFEAKADSELREIAILEEIESLKEHAKGQINAKPSKIARSKKPTGNMLELSIPDTHFGKLAWPTETGHEPWDTTISAATYTRAVDTLIDRSGEYEYDEILYVVGNDILNSNDAENMTAHGTIVTTDGRYHKTFWKVRSTVVSVIEKLRQIAPVRVMMVYGNHDTLAAWHLGDSLECYFHAHKDVVIDNQPTYRKYYQFGLCMLGYTHGDKGQRDDYPLLMATEQPKMFGETKYREMHIGHRHKTQTDEFHGVRVRTFSALCPPDDWHAENAFTGNLRNAEALKWNKEQGLLGTALYCDDAQEPIITKRAIVSK